jgi:hypothetical protein
VSAAVYTHLHAALAGAAPPESALAAAAAAIDRALA